MVLWMYEEYEHDKSSRLFYYGVVTVLSLTSVYIIIVKAELISNAGWGVIGTITGIILQQIYAVAFKKSKKEVKK